MNGTNVVTFNHFIPFEDLITDVSPSQGFSLGLWYKTVT